MVYLLECLQKTPPPVSSMLRLLWQHCSPAAQVELAVGTRCELQGSAVGGVGA